MIITIENITAFNANISLKKSFAQDIHINSSFMLILDFVIIRWHIRLSAHYERKAKRTIETCCQSNGELERPNISEVSVRFAISHQLGTPAKAVWNHKFMLQSYARLVLGTSEKDFHKEGFFHA